MKKRADKIKIRKWKNRFIKCFMILLLIVGGVLVFNLPIRNLIISKNTNHYQINQMSIDTLKENDKLKANFNFDKVKPVSSDRITWSQFNTQTMPVIGGIAVPDLGINLPIFKGLDNDNVAYGAGTMKEKQAMGQGNYTLASHNVTGFNNNTDLLFTPLEHAQRGMTIYVTNKENIYQYRINKVEVISPEHTDIIDDHVGKTEITLVTCADSKAKNRIIVHGSFEKKLSYSKRTLKMEDAFSKVYNQIL